MGLFDKKSGISQKWLYISVVLAGLGYFTYEVTLVLPILVLLVDKLVNSKRFNNKDYWQQSIPYWLLAGFYLFIRFYIINVGNRSVDLLVGWLPVILVQLKAVWKYIQLLLIPLGLNIVMPRQSNVGQRRFYGDFKISLSRNAENLESNYETR